MKKSIKNALINSIRKMTKFYLFTIMLFIVSCNITPPDPPEKLYPEKDIKHKLRKFNVKTTTNTSSSGFYFVVIGGYSSRTDENTNVRLYFENCRKEYQFLELPLSYVRIKIDSTVIEPYIVFNNSRSYIYNSEGRCYGNLSYHYVENAIISCRENDFQPDIDINDLK